MIYDARSKPTTTTSTGWPVLCREGGVYRRRMRSFPGDTSLSLPSSSIKSNNRRTIPSRFFQGSTFLFSYRILRFPVIVPRFFPVKYNIGVIYIVHEPMEQRASTESSSPSFVYAPRTHERNTQGTRTPRRREARRRSHNYAHPLELHSFIKVSEHGEREGEREGETCAAPC